MQRWQLTVGLIGTAALAAMLVPELGGGPSPLSPQAPASSAPAATPAPSVARGALTLTAGLDLPTLLAGEPSERLLVVTVKAAESEDDVRRPVNVGVVIDRSGSMSARGKMDYARQAAHELVASLQPDDRFSLVSFSDQARVLVPSTPVLDPDPLFRAVSSIHEGGGTNLYDGLVQGLEQVRAYASDDRVNRVVVLSDGIANVGVTDDGELARAAGRLAEQGIAVSTIGLGLDYNEDLLARMADQGGGTYRFVDDPGTLQAIFREELHQMSTVAATGVAVDIDLQGARLVDVYGYEAQPTDGKLRVWMGDVYGGQTRKVVLKVVLPPSAAGQTPAVAQVSLTEATEGVGATPPVQVAARVTTDRAEVERTANVELAVAGNAAVTARFADEAAIAFQSGRKEDGLRLLESAKLVAGETASRYNAPAAAAQARALDDQEMVFEALDLGSEDAKAEVKRSKEMNRGWSK